MQKVKWPIKRSILGLLFLWISISGYRDHVSAVGTPCLILAAVCAVSAVLKIRKNRIIKAEQAAAAAEKAEQERLEAEKQRAREEANAAAEAARNEKALEFQAELVAIPREKIFGKASTDPVDCPEFDGEFKSTNITTRTNIDKMFPLVVLDLETTGLSRTDDEIIEVGAVKFGPGFQPISRYHMRCKSRVPIPERITRINGITNEMVKDMPYFSQIAANFEKYISGCNLCGHNAASFDLPFLANNGVSIAPGVKVYDTLAIGATIFGGRRGVTLDNLCYTYKIYRPKSHNAIYDAFATSKILQEFIKEKTGKSPVE